jgi:Peptidase family S41
MLNKRDVLTGVLATSAIGAIPSRAHATDTLIAPAILQSDLALLKRVYTNLHPGLYRYSTPAQIEGRFIALSAQFTRPLALSAAYLEISKLLASVRCGHSYANFYSQTEAVQAQLFGGRNRLPFRFVWLNQMMVVTDPAMVSGLVKGTRITSINGNSARQILKALLSYVRADGHNIGKQTSLLSVNRDEGYQTFDIFHALHYGASDSFQLRGTLPSGATYSAQVPAIDLMARRTMTAGAPMLPNAPAWSLAVREDKIAIMTLPTFGLYRTSWDWKAWLATSFTQIKDAGCPSLIIDIRGNEGGRDDCGPEILSYLTDRPLPPQAGQRRTRYREVPADLNPILDTWDDSFRNWGDKAVARADGMYDLNDQQGRSGGEVTPKAPRFGGKVIVLTDASNSSATLQFCQMLRANGLGKIVGDTTGGNMRGINAEKFMFCRLPGTGLEVDVPLVGFFTDGAQADAGLVPDVPVSHTWRDIRAGNDPVMRRALAM